jgi:pimeloyl-ACP methyl ester carboxylesterase
MEKARPVVRNDVEAAPLPPLTAGAQRVPRLLRAGFAALGRVAPGLAAAGALRLWLTPPRPRRRPRRTFPARPFSLEVDGRRVAAWSAGDGPVVALMHGWGGHAGQLAELVSPLVEAGFRAVAFDAPGHGASAPSRLGRRQASFVDFAAGLEALQAVSGPLTAVIAHSGGAVATLLALRSGLRLQRAVLVAPMARPALYAARYGRELGFTGEVMARWQAEAERRVGFRWSDLDLVAAARALALPATLVIHDREDPDVPFTEGQAVAGAWPGAALHATTRLGHRRLLRDGAVVRAAVEFLAASGLARARG